VLLDNLLDPLLLEVLLQVVLHEELHGGTSAETFTLGVLGDGEGSTGGRLPNVLLVVVVLGGDLHLLGDKVRRVKTDTELTYLSALAKLLDFKQLTNHGDISTGRESLHECLGTGLCDRTEVVDEIGLGHTNTGIPDGEGTLLLVGGDSDKELLLSVEGRGVGKSLVSDLVESIGRVGDQFSKENLLVGVEGVDDQVQKLGDLGLLVSKLLQCTPDRFGRVSLADGERTWKPKVSVLPDIFDEI
jgi:hypothetical protein